VCDTTKGLCSFGIRYVDGSGWTANPTTDVVSIFNVRRRAMCKNLPMVACWALVAGGVMV